MLRRVTATVIVAWLATAGAAQAAGDAKAGATKAAACHGDEGPGVAANPALAGKSEADLVKMQYKFGAKANPIMAALAGSLSDQDMDDLSALYASLE